MPLMQRLWSLRFGSSGLSFVMTLMHMVISFLESVCMIPKSCLHKKRWADWLSRLI